MPARNAASFFSQHVALLDPLAFDDALCFDARLEPAPRADLRSGPIVKTLSMDWDNSPMIRSGLPSAMRGVIRSLRYDDNDVGTCTQLVSNGTWAAQTYARHRRRVQLPLEWPQGLHDGNVVRRSWRFIALGTFSALWPSTHIDR